MKTLKYILFTMIMMLSITVMAGTNSSLFYHDTPQGVVRGDQVRLEVLLNNPGVQVYDMYLFYRQPGSSSYQKVAMENEGFLYYASLNTADVTTGRIEYYIGYEGELGKTGTLPEISAQTNPYVMLVAPAAVVMQNDQVEITILSPDADETVSADELVIAAYLMGVGSDFDFSRSKLLIDGNNVTSMVEFADGVITFSPRGIRSGPHNIEINLYDAQDNMIGRKEWSFKASGTTEALTSANYRGSAFLDERYQDIYNIGDNFLRVGSEFSGRFSRLDASARLLLSSEESSKRQPVNRYSLNLRYNLSTYNNLYVRGGDFTPVYNPLTFYNKRVRGIQTGLQLGFFQFDFVYGQTNRAINGSTRQETSPDTTLDGQSVVATLIEGGTYAEKIMALRPGFRLGSHATWNLNLLNAKEDPKSIRYGDNPKESLIVGTDLNLNFDQRRILFDASVQASMANTNAAGVEITWDTLTSVNPDLKDNNLAKSMFNLLKSTGFLSVTQGLSPYPSMGLNLEATLRYFGNDLQLKYENVAKNFATPGNPYLLKDLAGFYVNDYLKILNNQLFLNLFYNNFKQDKSYDKLSTTNQELGATVSYFPVGNIPSFTIGYANISRSNDITLLDTALFTHPEYYMEDNSTQRFMFSTTYNVQVSRVKNAVSLTMNTYGRDEKADFKKDNTSDFTLYGIGVVSKFPGSILTRVNYSQSASIFGTTAASKYETNIQRIFLGVEYEMVNVISVDQFKPFVNAAFQTINNKDATGSFNTPRNNYTVGLYYRNQQLGVFSLRFDQIAYQLPGTNRTKQDLSDSIFNLRYQYNF
jgi:hypothetical protein